MTVFDNMAEAGNRLLNDYSREVEETLRFEQNTKVVAGQFVGYALDGTLRFQTPGGGFIRAFSVSGGGFPTGAIAQINISNPQGAFADASAPSNISKSFGKASSPQ